MSPAGGAVAASELPFTLSRRGERGRSGALGGAATALGGVAVGFAALALAYFLGHDWLENALRGNESPFAMTILEYLERWAPPLPGWFHAQGTGTYFLKNYGPGSYVPLWAASHVLPLTLVQLYRLAAFLTVPLSALGAAWLAWRWTGRFSIALLTVGLFLISPVSWGWLFSWGFYAQAVGFALTPFAIIAFEGYVRHGGTPRLLLCAITITAMSLAHPISGFVFVGIAFGLSIVLAFARRARLWEALGRSAVALAAALALGAAFWVPFFVTTARASERDLSFLAAHQLPYLELSQLAGISEDTLRRLTSFHPIAFGLFLLGTLVAAVARRRLVLGLALFAAACMLFTALPNLVPPVVLEPVSRIYSATNVRAIGPAMLLVPLVGAFGVVTLGGALFARAWRRLGRAGELAGIIVVAAVVLVLGSGGPYYGADTGLSRARLALFRLDDASPLAETPADRIAADLGLDGRSRIDISPRLGSVAKSLNAVSDASQVNLYFFQSSLLHAMWGYEQQVLFDGHDREQVRNLLDWFGLEYLLLNPSDLPEPLEQAGLARDRVWQAKGELFAVGYRVPDAKGVVSVTHGPAILVIGDVERAAYESVFRAGAGAGLDYRSALLVNGGERVDAFDLAALQNFDAIVLHGYHFADRGRGWDLLRRYVEGGGKIFVETGWQYVSDDWHAKELPSPAPVSATDWVELADWAFRGSADPVLEGVDLAAFAAPRYGDAGWGISTGPLRERATAVLRSADRPVLARMRVGKGTVVWSGMNLLGHYRLYASPAEARLLANIVRDLAGPRVGERRPEWQRTRPDRVEIAVRPEDAGAWVLFREALVPEWRATLGERELRLWKAGPGFVATKLTTTVSEGRLVIEQGTGLDVFLGFALSALAAATLLALAVRPGLFDRANAALGLRVRRLVAEPEDE